MNDVQYKYCIAGLGNIGILLSYFLRNESLAILSRRGKNKYEKLILRKRGEVIWSEKLFVYDITANVKCEMFLIAMKAYDVPMAITLLANKGESVAIFSNGLGLIEKAVSFFGIDFSLASSVTYGLTSCGEYCTELKGTGEMIIGGLKDVAYERAKMLSEDISRGGGEARAVEEIEPYIWLKGIVNSAINPITAILRKPNGILLENDSARELASIVASEGKSVAERKGIVLMEDPFNAIIKVAEKTKENMSSMLQDIINKRKTEIEFINGYIVAEGKRLGIEAKANLSLYYIIKAIEGSYNYSGISSQP